MYSFAAILDNVEEEAATDPESLEIIGLGKMATPLKIVVHITRKDVPSPSAIEEEQDMEGYIIHIIDLPVRSLKTRSSAA